MDPSTPQIGLELRMLNQIWMMLKKTWRLKIGLKICLILSQRYCLLACTPSAASPCIEH